MKKTFSITILICLAVIITANIFNNSNINYFESSTGLQSIQLEGGRTEIEMADINSDGFVDFLSIGDHGSPYVNTQEHGIMVWFGNGSGVYIYRIETGSYTNSKKMILLK